MGEAVLPNGNRITHAHNTLTFRPPRVGKKRLGKQFAEGIIRLYRLPDGWTDEDTQRLWTPETDRRGRIVRAACMSLRDKQRYLDYEAANQIMNAGRTQVLTYIGSSSGNSTQWAQYLAIGTGAITATSPTDTALANEVFRKAQSSYAVNGTQVDVLFSLGNSDAQVTMTNAGLWGNAASGTLGSGSLYTHALFAYTKGNYAVNIDYLINLL